MRRGRRIQIVEMPYAPPERVKYVVTKPIPVEIPQRELEEAVPIRNDPKKKQVRR